MPVSFAALARYPGVAWIWRGRGGRLERAAQDQAGSAIRESLFGNAAEARTEAAAALRLSKGGVVEYGAAFALGLSGEPAQAEAAE